MTTLASTVLGTVSILIQDTTNIRWPTSELLGYLNDGQREIVLYKPNAALSPPVAFSLVTGSKQSLPGVDNSNPAIAAAHGVGLILVDVIRNMGSGATPGRAIRVVSREVLDAQVPDWHTLTGAAVQHYTYSPMDPKHFYVYPAAAGTLYIELIYGREPVVVAAVGNNITLDDIWIPALVNYICYRAYSKDAEYAANAQAAASYYQQFLALMSGKTSGETGANPNVSMGDFNPNVPGMK